MSDTGVATPTATSSPVPDASPASATSQGVPDAASSDGVIWTKTMIGRLREDKLLSQERVIKILDSLPIGKEAALHLEECAQRAGLTDEQFRHALGWLTKFTHKNADLWTEPT